MQSGIHRNSALERVAFGRPAAEALVGEADLVGARRAFVTTTASLGTSLLVRGLTSALGARCVGLFDGVQAHSPRDCVIAGAAGARAAQADLLVAVGGGSVIDATKVMQLCVWNGIADAEDLDRVRSRGAVDPSHRDPGMTLSLRMVAIPTTLSAAEFTWYAGITDRASGIKEPYDHAYLIPRAVILDPAATLSTPLPLFLSSGIKAIDHAVERVCAPNANALSDASALHALRLLGHALPRVADDHADAAPRLNCQLAAWLSIAGGASGVGVGASHALGHVLGAHSGVPHGYTSCVTLPAVLRWNAATNRDRQRLISEALGEPAREAADIVADLVGHLGLPSRLADVGVGRDQFAAIAEKTLQERNIAKNPRPVRRVEDVLEILALAA